jgi:leucyl aminopeptidase
MKHKYTPTIPKADVIALPVFADGLMDAVRSFDTTIESYISSAISQDFSGKKGETALLYGGDKYSRLLLIGLGSEKDLSIRVWKQMVGSAIIMAQGKKAQTVGIYLPTVVVETLGAKGVGSSTAISADVAEYAFDHHKKESTRTRDVKELFIFGTLVSAKKKQFDSGLSEGRLIADGVNTTRHLGNTPPSIMTPTFLASEAVKSFRGVKSVKVTVLGRAEIKKHGMGCLIGVSQGSKEEPKFIIVEYSGTTKDKKPTVLVGKGITFDSGGLSLKPSNSMSDMKFDMLGGATVIGILKSAVNLGLKKNIIGLIPSCENMPSGESYRPDDILTAMNGLSVEVQNTDAEGRLILADALSYVGAKYKPKEVIDFATLTGACVVALGNERSGLFSTDEKLVEKISTASFAVGEQLWRLPLGEEYREAMKSDVADIKNIGGVPSGGYAGASTGAAFLETFTEDVETGRQLYPWAHIDLSASYYPGKGKSYIRGGSNGFGVETFVEFLRK